MAVLILRVVYIFEPLLQLAVSPDAVGCDLLPHRGELRCQLPIGVENASGIRDSAEESSNDLMVHRRTHDQATLFG